MNQHYEIDKEKLFYAYENFEETATIGRKKYTEEELHKRIIKNEMGYEKVNVLSNEEYKTWAWNGDKGLCLYFVWSRKKGYFLHVRAEDIAPKSVREKIHNVQENSKNYTYPSPGKNT